MLQLYSTSISAYSQRVRAVLTHLKVPFATVDVDLDAPDADFLRLSPTGKVPLIVDGKLKLYESAVICEYLADRHGWRDAFDPKIENRGRERLAMATWDQTIAPAFYRGLQDGALDVDTRKAVLAELKELAQTVQATGKRVGSLLSFHVAPFWARMTWLRDATPIADLIGEWIDVKAWLDAAVAHGAIRATLPDRETAVRFYRARYCPTR